MLWFHIQVCAIHEQIHPNQQSHLHLLQMSLIHHSPLRVSQIYLQLPTTLNISNKYKNIQRFLFAHLPLLTQKLGESAEHHPEKEPDQHLQFIWFLWHTAGEWGAESESDPDNSECPRGDILENNSVCISITNHCPALQCNYVVVTYLNWRVDMERWLMTYGRPNPRRQWVHTSSP